MSFRICDVMLCKKINFVLVCFSGSVGKFQEPIVALCATFVVVKISTGLLIRTPTSKKISISWFFMGLLKSD